MRIVFTSAEHGGFDSYVRAAANWLAEHQHTVHIVYSQQPPPAIQPTHERIHIHHAPYGNIHYYLSRLRLFSPKWIRYIRALEGSWSVAHTLRQIRDRVGFDLAEIHDGGSPSFVNGIPFVLKMHGAEWVVAQYCEGVRVSAASRHIQRRVMCAARQVVAISRSLANFIAGACNFPPGLIEFVPYPTDFSKIPQQRTALQPPPYRLMCVGRLERRKGTHTLIQALKKVWRFEPETHLHLYGGDGNFGRDEIEHIVPESEHGGRIHFEGFVTHDSLLQQYGSMHLYVTPTRYETRGYTIQEAMACGCPVIASDIGAVPELVRHQENGWLVPRDDVDALAETIVFALRNPQIREEYGIAARNFARQFDIDRVMPRQLELYEQAIR